MIEFIDWLKNRVENDLPGEQAQYLMAPQLRKSSGHYLENNTNYKKGAVAVLLYPKNEKIYTVLTLRNSYKGMHSAQVSFPGGKIESSDASYTEAALREAEEEIGVKKENLQVIGNLTPLYIPVSNFLVFPVVAYSLTELAFLPDTREVNRIIETPIDHLFNNDIKKKTQINASYANALTAPYYDIDKEIVWGATAMILSEFEQLILPYQHKL